jgi:glycosyltransferase involved in cell wall biosynthesis
MRRSLGTAAGVVMSTREAAERVRSGFPELRTKPIVAIPNGFDAADFESPPPTRSDASFRIVHTGYLHTELGRDQQRVSSLRRLIGGSVPDVEIITRSHVYLLEAVNRLLAEEPSFASRLEVHFAGVISPGDAEIAASCPVSHLHGYVTHAESVALMRTADLLFLPMQNLPPGRRAGIVPGKTYEYLASGRPILGALPDGDARDILEEAGGAFLCRPDDVDAMQRIIRGAVSGEIHLPPRNEEFVAGFAYERLCERVAELLEQVAG